MKADFEATIKVVRASRADVWPLVRDVELLADASEAISDVRSVVPDAEWTVSLVRQVGRFKLAAPLVVRVVNEVPEDRIEIEADGQDRAMGTRLSIRASMSHREQEETGVSMLLKGTYEVTGRIANLGSNIVRRHATEMVREFGEGFEREAVKRLEGGSR